MKMFLNRDERCAQWIQNLIAHLDKIKVLNLQSREKGQDDFKLNNDYTVRRGFRIIFECLLSIVCVVIYALMFQKLMPEASIADTDNDIEREYVKELDGR